MHRFAAIVIFTSLLAPMARADEDQELFLKKIDDAALFKDICTYFVPSDQLPQTIGAPGGVQTAGLAVFVPPPDSGIFFSVVTFLFGHYPSTDDNGNHHREAQG